MNLWYCYSVRVTTDNWQQCKMQSSKALSHRQLILATQIKNFFSFCSIWRAKWIDALLLLFYILHFQLFGRFFIFHLSTHQLNVISKFFEFVYSFSKGKKLNNFLKCYEFFRHCCCLLKWANYFFFRAAVKHISETCFYFSFCNPVMVLFGIFGIPTTD